MGPVEQTSFEVEDDLMRVLVVIRWPVGGIRTYILYNYPLLIEAGYRFTFLGPGDPTFRSFAQELRSWPGTEFVEAPVAGKQCDLRRTVRSQLRSGRYALMHSHGFTAGVKSVLGSLGLNVPHVVTSHDVVRTEQFPGMMGRPKRWVLGYLLGWANLLISVSQDAHENLLEFLPTIRWGLCRFVVIKHGIDLESLRDSSSEQTIDLRERLGIGKSACLIGFLGRFMEQKGFLPLLSAIKILDARPCGSDWHVVAVGNGDYRREYQAEAQRLQVTDRLTFLDFVRNPGGILRQLDLLVMPSLWEAAGMLAMEAMLLGVPVLGSDCIGLREVLRGSPSVMTPAGNVESLAKALCQAVESPWREKALAYIPEAQVRFDARRSARELLQTLNEALARHHPASR
ncbi:MAG TPA: glycosyltransferase family 4 protein [Gemmataceae bacterium]|nr:glycosyltransferase family 4 protein [Gemmataceae bacterium]